jgi:hypothetical protein
LDRQPPKTDPDDPNAGAAGNLEAPSNGEGVALLVAKENAALLDTEAG